MGDRRKYNTRKSVSECNYDLVVLGIQASGRLKVSVNSSVNGLNEVKQGREEFT